jgi:hypothetical protein
MDSKLFWLFFVFGSVLFLVTDNIYIWILCSTLMFFVLLLQLIRELESGFPLAEIIGLVFLIENSLSLSLIYIIEGQKISIGDSFYLLVPIKDYLPFATLSCIFFYLGLKIIQTPKFIWINFIENSNFLFSSKNLNFILIIGIIGLFSLNYSFGAFDFIAYLFSQLFLAGLLLIFVKKKSIFNTYFLLGISLQLYTVIRTGMFGGLIVFLVYSSILYMIILVRNGMKFNYLYILMFTFMSFVFLATLQNVKTQFRQKALNDNYIESNELLMFNTITSTTNQTILSWDFFKPILYRLNQGYLVSAAIKKVPDQVPFAQGKTIIDAFLNSIIPRYFSPNKEEAGGRNKIKTYTNVELVGNTSMNIGILGEAYVNFGKYGASLFILFYGMLISLFEKKILSISLVQPIYLLAFPVYFSVLIGSGSDFLLVINTIVKSILVLFTLSFFWEKSKS